MMVKSSPVVSNSDPMDKINNNTEQLGQYHSDNVLNSPHHKRRNTIHRSNPSKQFYVPASSVFPDAVENGRRGSVIDEHVSEQLKKKQDLELESINKISSTEIEAITSRSISSPKMLHNMNRTNSFLSATDVEVSDTVKLRQGEVMVTATMKDKRYKLDGTVPIHLKIVNTTRYQLKDIKMW
eukprot:CAMPEP_0174266732 /NCGR_PEP_ID=MMETSP0439-20130205/31232_1 /TAXON_ID=0 /ORGANISM="Stereomyxa ramosa, Strain Chinc5" /LENGTH=181 /DNA_ID=CAMNT_0015353859 /DNA_START=678 /DNA_END=1220 /DNA_ORIENTATION=+